MYRGKGDQRRGGQAHPWPSCATQPPSSACSPSALCLVLLPSPTFYQALSHLILLLLSLTALSLLSQLQSQYFTLSLFSSLSLFFFFFNTFCLLCCSLALLPFLSVKSSSLSTTVVLPAVPSAHKFLPDISASFLPWQGLILLPPQRAAHREVEGKKDLWALIPFSPFSLPSFPPSPALSLFFHLHVGSPALLTQFTLRQGRDFAVQSLLPGFCRTQQRRRDLR